MNTPSPNVPASCTVMTFGCDRRAMARASRSSRVAALVGVSAPDSLHDLERDARDPDPGGTPRRPRPCRRARSRPGSGSAPTRAPGRELPDERPAVRAGQPRSCCAGPPPPSVTRSVHAAARREVLLDAGQVFSREHAAQKGEHRVFRQTIRDHGGDASAVIAWQDSAVKRDSFGTSLTVLLLASATACSTTATITNKDATRAEVRIARSTPTELIVATREGERAIPRERSPTSTIPGTLPSSPVRCCWRQARSTCSGSTVVTTTIVGLLRGVGGRGRAGRIGPRIDGLGRDRLDQLRRGGGRRPSPVARLAPAVLGGPGRLSPGATLALSF